MATETSGAPLEELMLAMDVVDTLRHRRGLAERALKSGDRRAKLIEQLRQIYQSQGIEVSQEVLEQGVTALEEDRFSYTPPAESLSVKLARLYIRRSRWLKGVLTIIVLVLAVFSAKFVVFDLPQSRAIERIPSALDDTFSRIVGISKSDAATKRAQALLQSAKFALGDDEVSAAEAKLAGMQMLLNTLTKNLEIRVVSQLNKRSGVVRIPDANSDARNYYLIVQAVDRSGRPYPLEVKSGEDGAMRVVDSWGLSVDEETFQSFSADKRDDGIIQNNRVGVKPRGYLEPNYSVATTGAIITDW